MERPGGVVRLAPPPSTLSSGAATKLLSSEAKNKAAAQQVGIDRWLLYFPILGSTLAAG